VVNGTDVVEFPTQTTSEFGRFTWAVGFTVIVNVIGVPEHETPPLVYDGVTVIVETKGVVPVLTAVNESISPEPVAANPIDGSEFAQL